MPSALRSSYRLVATSALALVLVVGVTSAAAAPIYTGDSGVASGSAGYSAGNDAVVGNYFTTLAGFNLLNSISVYWGELPGDDVILAIIDDPNGDTFLADGVVLTTLTVNPTAGEVGSFSTYGIAPTLVSAGFFIAAYIENGPGGLFPIYFDNSGANFGGSRAVQGNGSLLAMSQSAVFFPSNATWMIRADAAAVPEPATIGLTLLGLGALVARRRKA